MIDVISNPEEFAEYWAYSNAGPLSEAVRMRDAEIRANALKDAADRAVQWWLDAYAEISVQAIRAAILNDTEGENT